MTQTTPASPSTPRHFAYIDALRGLAVLAVILYHCSTVVPACGRLQTLLGQGSRGVMLFFVLSAFTLFHSLANRRETEAIRNFYVRRIFRILPLYYLATMFYVWFYSRHHGMGFSSKNILEGLTFANHFSPYWINQPVPGGWSITVEMTFYLFVPMLFHWLKNLRAAVYFFIASLLVSVCLTRYLSHHPQIPDSAIWKQYLLYYFPAQIPVFALGFVAYFLARDAVQNKSAGMACLLIACAGAALFAFWSLRYVPGEVLYAGVSALLIYALALQPSRLIVNPALEFLGKVSFSAYLTHFAALEALRHWGSDLHGTKGFLLYSAAVLIGTLLLSVFTWKYVEIPGQQAGKAILAYWRKQASARL